jgi:uncharacterized protein YgiB involved in biofilm formation
MKRSRTLALTSLMALGGVSLTACGDGDAPKPPDQGPPVDAYAYTSIQACKDANEVPDDQCDSAGKIAIAEQDKVAPRYEDAKTCEDVYGPGQCVPRSQAGHGSFWGPLITGFVVGRMLDGGWRGTGLYRDYRDGGYYTGYGGRMYTDYSTGRTRIGARGIDPPAVVKSTPPKVQTRASVISRGGFGGRMSARSAGSRGYGGGRGFGG